MKKLYRLKSDFTKCGEKTWFFSFVEEERNEDSVIYKEYNNFPHSEDYEKIKAICFLVFDEESSKINKLPDFLDKLPNLLFLSIPIDWLCRIDIPLSVKSLVLTSTILEEQQYHWCEDLKMNNLKYLSIDEQIKPFDINFKYTPNLEWIDLDMKAERNDKKLIELSQLKTLKHLSFSHAQNFDIFSPFSSHPIESLELFACRGKQFPIENIKSLKSLKYIRINNINTVFDCSWLVELPNLIEFDILNVKNVLNIEQLLRIKTLKSISVLDCNNPFKDKMLFKKKGYDILDIDWA